MNTLNVREAGLLAEAKAFFVGHDAAVGVLLLPDDEPPLFLKSGNDGGPWGGTQRGGFPRGKGWAFTQGGPSQGNIATHVEGHAVAVLWQKNFKKGILLVDRPMCDVCSRNLPYTLPVGGELVVKSENEGITLLRSTHGS
jgi:hypothetical protein